LGSRFHTCIVRLPRGVYPETYPEWSYGVVGSRESDTLWATTP